MALSSLRSGVFSAANGGTAYDQAVGSFGGVKPMASDLLSSDGLPWTGDYIRPYTPTTFPTGQPYTPTTFPTGQPYTPPPITAGQPYTPYTPPAVPPWTPPPAVPPYTAPPAPPATTEPPDPPPPTTPEGWGFTYDQEGGGFSVDLKTGRMTIDPTTAMAGWMSDPDIASNPLGGRGTVPGGVSSDGEYFDRQDFLRDAYIRNAPDGVLGSLGNNYFIEVTQNENDEGELSNTYELVNRNSEIVGEPMPRPPGSPTLGEPTTSFNLGGGVGSLGSSYLRR